MTIVIVLVILFAVFFYLRTRKPKDEKIVENLKELNIDNYSSFMGRMEIAELPKILSTNEKMFNIIQGRYNGGNGILVATNRRLIFIDKSLLRLKVTDFPLDKVGSIQCDTQMFGAMIKIQNSGNNSAKITQVKEDMARKFCQTVNDKIAESKEQKPIIVNHTSQSSVLDEIEKLAKLKNDGILTEEEFAAKKQKMLENI